MNKAIVFLGTVAALAAGWAVPEVVLKDWTPPATFRLLGRSGGAPAAAAAPAPTEPSTPAAPAVVPGAQPGKAEPAKPAAPKPAPTKPAQPAAPAAPAVIEVVDVRLPVVQNSKEITFAKMREVHVDRENTMTWHGEGAKRLVYEDLKHLGADLRNQQDAAFVIVADADVPWRQIRDMLVQGQNNYVTNSWIGVASSTQPTLLRALPVPQTPRSDDPMPEGTTFHVVIESKEGPPVLVADGKKVETFPADLAQAWYEWKKAHPDMADTSKPETTRVVLEAPKSASVGHVLQVLDVFRGVGIQSERLTGGTLVRPMK